MSRFRWLEFEPPKKGSDDSSLEKLPSGAFPSEVAGVDLTDAAQVLRLADEFYRKLEYEKALRYFSKALSLDPNLEDAWFGQLLCLLDLGETPEALTWAIKANKIFSKSSNIISSRALALARGGNLVDAMAFSDGAMKSDSVSWFPWLARGEILALSGASNAEFCMMKARELSPKDWLVSFKVAQSYSNSPLYEKAIPIFQKVLAQKPDVPEIYFEVGKVQKKLGLIDSAVESFQRAIKLAPNEKKYSDAYLDALNSGFIPKVVGWFRKIFK
ncbi:MAG: tetratricopeptide repeat protein [Candidatus Riflebacteria bacterium]|nr:tetratricopeptide repeat protein [Candidatus Riflebacteria bacterium]